MAGTALDMHEVLAAEGDAQGVVEDELAEGQGEVDGIDEKLACSAIDGSSDLVASGGEEATLSAPAPAGAGGFVSISQLDGVPSSSRAASSRGHRRSPSSLAFATFSSRPSRPCASALRPRSAI